MSEAPAALSVVVPSVNGWSHLGECLASLARERKQVDLEVLVADRCGPEVTDEVGRCFPWVRVLPAPGGTSIPDLRAMAIDAAVADSVAVIEDHILVPPGWARSLLHARASFPVVAGSIVNGATDGLVNWVAFLCEYGPVMPPLEPGFRESIPGNNTVYARDLLVAHREVTHSGQWENALHRALRAAGVALRFCPSITVAHRKPLRLSGYLSERFWFSRSWAGLASDNLGILARMLHGAAALVALPPVLIIRLLPHVWRAPLPVHRRLAVVPLLVPCVLAWSLGEAAGYWAGPGNSLARVC